MDCPECGVARGRWHQAECGWEQCAYCGEHAADCDCVVPLDDRLAWTGQCPWLDACLAWGFFEREVGGAWIPCRAEDPGSEPDLSRLMSECVWDRAEKRFVSAIRSRRAG